MNFASIGRKLLPHFIIVLIFLLVSCVYMSPVFNGKVMAQHDIKMFSGSYQETKAYQEKTGERTLWTNSMFGGMPTYQIAPYAPNNMLGTAWLFDLFVSGHSLPKPVNVIFLYCLSFYLLLLAFRVNPWLSMIGAFAFAFSSFNTTILLAGHMLQAYALATGPLVLAAAVFTIRFKKYFLGGAFFAVALALHLRTNHPQMTYYFMIVLALYMLFEAIYYLKEKQLLTFVKSVFAIGVGGALAIGTYMTFFLTTNEYSKVSTRGETELTAKSKGADSRGGDNESGLDISYAFDYSYGMGETFTLMIPDFYGGAQDAIGNVKKDVIKSAQPEVRDQILNAGSYWGESSQAGPYYFGAIVCFLFLLGFLIMKTHYRWWILAVALLSIMLSWGKNFMSFNEFMFYHFPLYNKFRSVNFAMFMAAVVFPLLALLTLNKVLDGLEWNKKTRRNILIAFGFTGGLCLIFAIMPSFLSFAGDFLNESELKESMNPKSAEGYSLLADARAEILQADAWRSFFFILLACAVVWLYSMKWQIFGSKSGKYIVIAIFSVLILVDQIPVNKRTLTDKKFERKTNVTYEPLEADIYIQQDPDPDYRVLSLWERNPERPGLIGGPQGPFNDASNSYFHKSMGGYSGAKIRRFQDIASTYLYTQTGLILQNAGRMPGDQLLNILQSTRKLGIYNMMDCKYIIAGPTAKDVIKNPFALDHAWFVKGVKYVQNADQELAGLDGFNPADTAIIDVGNRHPEFKTYMEGFNPQPDPTATIKLDVYKPNALRYTTNAATEQLAVFSEVYYDNKLGWDVFVDGQKQQHIRADYLLRAMRVPAGHHVIEFKFEPQSFAKGEKISLFSSLAMLFGLIGSAAWEIWRGRKSKEEEVPEED